VRIVDLSSPIEPSAPGVPEFARIEIEYTDHKQGAAGAESVFGIPRRLLRDEECVAAETFTYFSTHGATHVDAPYHYNSTIQGKPAQTIDELPLDLFIGPGVVVDFTGKADGDAITAQEMESALAAAGHELRERDIVLVRTGRDAFYGEHDYPAHGAGVTPEATRWLFEHGVVVMGIDAWTWDRPLHLQAREAIERNEQGIFMAAHQVNLPYCQIERLVNLGALPPTGFQVLCFPLKIVRASGAPARVVALLD
jgi:kynurenine formamidase